MKRFLRSPLLWTFVLSFVLLLAVGGWLLTDPATSRSEALKTGGVAGAAIVALYALWLNDRRRRVEERRQEVERQRQELELRRADQDRDRISDERFAKAVELLGHDADQVRVGALHALAGLARGRELYRQTVLDILCSYLRRPFDHPRYKDTAKRAGNTAPEEGSAEEDQELQVRQTAQRLIGELLPAADSEGTPGYDLDLTGAVLEYFDLSGRKIGKLLLRYGGLYSSTNLSGCVFLGPVYLTGSGTKEKKRIGYFRCEGAKFEQRAWFSGVQFSEDTEFRGTVFAGETSFKDSVFAKDAVFADAEFKGTLDLRRARFEGFADLSFREPPGTVSLYNTTVEPARDHELPADWSVETLPDGRARLTVKDR
ncbi:pentapeptide repeat-containing protein [Amycolatopsis sp. EV170708-02-1]|uniref:pentapeptide repeat-containing protein n=1 Tax=Amycolatopsis sp. EV170708-02-1 TaxID=2919322 RepID=UPI001F0BF105|nr:pentapeptide repeat-containing protein [Amycolatopsis sp. EV170708-02-1]UMP03129.1 pentapeptide repeat-containing protein [Amycolatopsis sp. EV170708-02-1]